MEVKDLEKSIEGLPHGVKFITHKCGHSHDYDFLHPEVKGMESYMVREDCWSCKANLFSEKYGPKKPNLAESLEGLPKPGFDPLDIISPPAVIAIFGLIVTVIVLVVVWP